MTTDEIKNLVQLYFDNELEKDREPLLFSLLSGDYEAREYFKQLNLIRTVVDNTVEQFPEELEEKIFSSIPNAGRLVKKEEESLRFRITRSYLVPALSLAAILVMMIISMFFYSELRDYKSKVDMISEQVKGQNQTIELILNNSLQPAVIKAAFENEILIKSNL